MDVFDKIRAQQPEQRTAVWMVGEQLADIIRHDPAAHEILLPAFRQVIAAERAGKKVLLRADEVVEVAG